VSALPYLVALWLFGIGVYGLCTTKNYLHAAGCLAVVQSSTYVLLLAIGDRPGATAPAYQGQPHGAPVVDSVVQALALTDVVVGAAITALILSLAIGAAKRGGTLHPAKFPTLEG
jgi:multicomponent Na+:H+ antiporter subunit C